MSYKSFVEALNPRRCGDCRFWITSKCPKEKYGPNGEKAGGPSARLKACEKFELTKQEG